jgi:hypothetical protein
MINLKIYEKKQQFLNYLSINSFNFIGVNLCLTISYLLEQDALLLWHLLLHKIFIFLHLHVLVLQPVTQLQRMNPCDLPVSFPAAVLTESSICGTFSTVKLEVAACWNSFRLKCFSRTPVSEN